MGLTIIWLKSVNNAVNNVDKVEQIEGKIVEANSKAIDNFFKNDWNWV